MVPTMAWMIRPAHYPFWLAVICRFSPAWVDARTKARPELRGPPAGTDDIAFIGKLLDVFQPVSLNERMHARARMRAWGGTSHVSALDRAAIPTRRPP
nr:hypothetical protein [Bradyrhizobium sp. WSM3983]